MPQLNKSFSKAKMNKDFDERIVPSGEYRDALNIQISTSDESDVGSAQTLLGNVLISSDMVPAGSYCVGSIANNKEDKIYYLVAGPRFIPRVMNYQVGCWKDYIIEYDVKTEVFKYVFVDIYRTHLLTTAASDGRTQFVDTWDGPPMSSVRPEMLVNGYLTDGTHLIQSNEAQDVEITSTDNTNSSISIFSTAVDYSLVANQVPSGTLLQCTSKRLLNFEAYDKFGVKNVRNITGINIIDGMLFWTDNFSEPKKINIKRSIAGTGGSTELPASTNIVFDGDNANWHTRLCITPDKHNNLRVKRKGSKSNYEAWFTKEENITVIKKAPKTPPRLVMSQHEDGRIDANSIPGVTFSPSTNGISGPPGANSLTQTIGTNNYVKKPGDTITGVMVDNPVQWIVGDTILLNQQQEVNSAEGFTEYDVRVTVNAGGGACQSGSACVASTGPFDFTIQSINTDAIDEEQKLWNLRLEERKPMFEFKFVRFAYRYKYEDGEYSTFSPWSEPAFLPGEYDFLPIKGYNLGMTNRLRELTITNYITEDSERPQDVIQVDLLYKDESSPNIYTVESIKMTDGWTDRGEYLWPDIINNGSNISESDRERGRYRVTSELIHAALPSNQLLRQWDNVPRKALAQTISGNRLIYGNYIQNFDLTHPRADKEIKPIINVSLQAYDAPLNAPPGTSTDPLNGLDTTEGFAQPGKTCRSLRTYQVGVVYSDEYGRETPVLIGEAGTGSLTIEKENSSTLNQLKVDIASEAPSFAKYYKYFIKETTNEYYNMAMDRWYQAEDGNIWLSFASADRNKVDIETSIILKKKHDKHEPVTDPARYKILAIEDSAPPFIATNSKTLGKLTDGAGGVIGASTTGFPLENFSEIRVDEACTGFSEIWLSGDATGATDIQSKVHNGTLWMRARTDVIKSDWYQVSTYIKGTNNIQHKFKSDKPFGPDMAFTSADGTFANRISGLQIEFADRKVERKKEFEGRFFVKIHKDLVLIDNLLTKDEPEYRVIKANKIHYLNMPNQTSTEIDTGTQLMDWERCAALCQGDLCAPPGGFPNGYLNPDFATPDGSDAINKQLFFKTMNSGYQTGYTTAGCGCFRKGGTKDWCDASTISQRKSPNGNFFIDAKTTRAQAQHTSFTTCTSTGHDRSKGKGIFNDGMSMDIGYFSNYHDFWSQDDNDWMSLLLTAGTKFRFREDHDGIVYKVTGGSGDIRGVDNAHYGKHFNYKDDPSAGVGNNLLRWRVDFERVDFPGVGLPHPGNATKYHPLGMKSTTGVDGNGPPELGYWGGQVINYDIGSSNFRDSEMHVPLPYGYQGIGNGPIGISGSTIYTHPPTGETVTGLEQAIRWRQHPTKYHFIEIVEEIEDEDSDWSSKNPAIWETEPKEDIGLDIYYEASPNLPVKIDYTTNEMFAPYGSLLVKGDGTQGGDIPVGTKIQSWSGNKVVLDNAIDLTSSSYQGGSRFGFKRPDGFISYAITNEFGGFFTELTLRGSNHYPPHPTNNNYSDAPHNQPATLSWYNAFAFGNGIESDRIRDDFNQKTIENGVKASTVLAEQYSEDRRKTGLISSGIYNSSSGVNRLNQFIQAEKITKDLNPSYGSIQKLHARETNIVTLCEDKCAKVLANKNILFNADGSGNAGKSGDFFGDAIEFATNYGISTNPESFATDLSNRIYFADRSRGAVLRLSGDGITNISDYGMKDWFNDHLNPLTTSIIGSFDDKKSLYNISISGKIKELIGDCDDGYNNNCDEKDDDDSGPNEARGCICNGENPDNPVGKAQARLEGSDRVVCIKCDFENGILLSFVPDPEIFGGSCENISVDIDGGQLYNTPDQQGGWSPSYGDPTFEAHCGYVEQSSTAGATNTVIFNKTLSFSEKSKGWVSFKSFIPENGISINNNYYTFKNGDMYKHHANINRNLFYGIQYDSSIDVIFNDYPEVVKSFAVLNYEGTRARISTTKGDPHASVIGDSIWNNEYFDLNEKDGWYVSDIVTTLQTCGQLEFKSKEGKWFTPIKGDRTTLENLDEQEFSVQGIGQMAFVQWGEPHPDDPKPEPTLHCLNISPIIECNEILGCTDPYASNYNPLATLDDGSCQYITSGCTDPAATNYDIDATVDDGSCYYVVGGCMDCGYIWEEGVLKTWGFTVYCNDTSLGSGDGSPATNPGSLNYNDAALVDDGSCCSCVECNHPDIHVWEVHHTVDATLNMVVPPQGEPGWNIFNSVSGNRPKWMFGGLDPNYHYGSSTVSAFGECDGRIAISHKNPACELPSTPVQPNNDYWGQTFWGQASHGDNYACEGTGASSPPGYFSYGTHGNALMNDETCSITGAYYNAYSLPYCHFMRVQFRDKNGSWVDFGGNAPSGGMDFGIALGYGIQTAYDPTGVMGYLAINYANNNTGTVKWHAQIKQDMYQGYYAGYGGADGANHTGWHNQVANGGPVPYSQTLVFAELCEGEYRVIYEQDAAGCSSEQRFTITPGYSTLPPACGGQLAADLTNTTGSNNDLYTVHSFSPRSRPAEVFMSHFYFGREHDDAIIDKLWIYTGDDNTGSSKFEAMHSWYVRVRENKVYPTDLLEWINTISGYTAINYTVTVTPTDPAVSNEGGFANVNTILRQTNNEFYVSFGKFAAFRAYIQSMEGSLIGTANMYPLFGFVTTPQTYYYSETIWEAQEIITTDATGQKHDNFLFTNVHCCVDNSGTHGTNKDCLGVGPDNRSPRLGCMDPTANNYDPNANEDDGSCDYSAL